MILDRLLDTNRLYDQGWLYLNTSEDLAVEIIYPEIGQRTTYADGSVWDRTMEAGSHTYTGDLFDFQEGLYIAEFDESKSQTTHDLTADKISFGRARGTVVFINERYVSEVRPSEDGRSRELVTVFSDYGYFSGRWYEDIKF